MGDMMQIPTVKITIDTTHQVVNVDYNSSLYDEYDRQLIEFWLAINLHLYVGKLKAQEISLYQVQSKSTSLLNELKPQYSISADQWRLASAVREQIVKMRSEYFAKKYEAAKKGDYVGNWPV